MSLIPLIHDLLPMILPSSIFISRAPQPAAVDPTRAATDDPKPDGPSQGPPVRERAAVVDKSDKLCAAGEILLFSLCVRRYISGHGQRSHGLTCRGGRDLPP